MGKGQIKQKQATIDKSAFEKLCNMQCTETEIAAFFEVCRDTLIDWCKATYGVSFSTIYKEKRECGKSSLRRYQWLQAEKNPTMAIWLGKQYLGQKDVIETQVANNGIIEDLIGAINNAKGTK